MKKILCILTAVCVLFAMSATGSMAGTIPAEDPAGAALQQAADEDAIQEDAEVAENAAEPAPEDAQAAALQAMPQIEAAAEAGPAAEVQAEANAAPAAPAEQPRDPALTKAAPSAASQTAAPQTLPKVKKLKAYAGYKQIKLKWKKVKGATSYVIQRKVKGGKKWSQVGTSNTSTYIDKVEMYKTYTYRVYAVNGTAKSKPAKISKKCVSKMRIFITFRSSRSYGKGVKVKAGQRVMSDKYGGGKYYFKAENGKYYSVPRYGVRNQKADYVKINEKNDNNYSKAEATFFINEYLKSAKIKSNKKYLIWVSSYNQHVYIFKKSKGKWVATKHNWECSMGKASTPSPTGNKTLHKKIGHRHGISYWNCFSSLNALHGVHSGWGAYLGRLASHGCIRNQTKNAKWIYYNCPKGTKVIVY